MPLIKKFLTPKNTALLVIFVLFFLLLRWNSFASPFERDEGEYAYSAWILHQGIMPYENSFMQKPPMIIYTYALGQLFDKEGLVSPRILAGLFVLSTTLLLGLIARKTFGKNAGWIAVFLVTPMLTLPINTPFAANIENFMLLPLVGLLAVYIFRKNTNNLLIWTLAGLLSALTFLYKPVGLPIILFVYSVWILEIYKKEKKVLPLVKKISASILGAIVVSFVILSPFILTNSLNKLIESAFAYNLSYAGFEGFGIQNFFNFMGGRYIRYYWPLYLLIIYFLVKRSQKWWYWAGLLGAVVLSVYSSPMGHYYILVMPFWALLATGAVVDLSKSEYLRSRLRDSAGLVVAMLVAFILVFPFREQFGKTTKELNVWVYGTVNPFVDALEAGKRVEEITADEDKVFVAGSEPEIYFYAKRLAPTRFVITYPLNITSSFREPYQKELVSDLKRDPPRAIVVSNREHSGLWNEGSPRIFIDFLENEIRNNYRLVGGYYWSRAGGTWIDSQEDNMSKDEIENSSLLLYVRSF